MKIQLALKHTGITAFKQATNNMNWGFDKKDEKSKLL